LKRKFLILNISICNPIVSKVYGASGAGGSAGAADEDEDVHDDL
jgi:hypothetical protein